MDFGHEFHGIFVNMGSIKPFQLHGTCAATDRANPAAEALASVHLRFLIFQLNGFEYASIYADATSFALLFI